MKVEDLEEQKEIFRNNEEFGKRAKPLNDCIVQFCFDPECVFLLINPNCRTILHYYLHGIIKFFLTLKKNVDILLAVIEEAYQNSCSDSLWKEPELFPASTSCPHIISSGHRTDSLFWGHSL